MVMVVSTLLTICDGDTEVIVCAAYTGMTGTNASNNASNVEIEINRLLEVVMVLQKC